MPASNQSPPGFVLSVRQLIEARELVEAECRLRDRIFSDPLDEAAFALLSEVHGLLGKPNAARVAQRRCRQLQQIAANSKPGHAAEHYGAVCADVENPAGTLELEGDFFAGLRIHEYEGRTCAIGCSVDGNAFLKIELETPSDGGNGLSEELAILRLLSDQNCTTSAGLLASGSIDRLEVKAFGGANGCGAAGLNSENDSLPYVILEYVRADRGGFGVADIVLTLLEQQALGIYQNCLALPHIRFDSIQGICRFTNYRSAILLDDSVRALSPRAYLDWCYKKEEERISSGGPASFLKGRSGEFEQLWHQDRFLLVRSQIFGRQRIADSPIPCVQDSNHAKFTLRGSVRVADRIGILDKLRFDPGERVLDLGCGAGAVGRHLAGRGCEVTGVDCDDQLVRQSRLLANLEGVRSTYRTCDLEYEFPEGFFDTVLLLAVLSHVSNRVALAQKILAAGIKRIVIECSPSDSGFRWQGSAYHAVDPLWEFDSPEEMKAYLLKLFPEHPILSDWGSSDTKRTILLLEKKGTASS